jgi:hypothetical protein
MARHWAPCSVFALVAAGCGGGDSTSSVQPPPPAATAETPIAFTADSAAAAGELTHAVAELVAQLGELGADVLTEAGASIRPGVAAPLSLNLCLPGRPSGIGSNALTYNDIDASSTLTRGDTLSITFTNCVTNATNAVLNGNAAWTVADLPTISLPYQSAVALDANFQSLSVGQGTDAGQVNGSLSTLRTRHRERRHLEVRSGTGDLRLTVTTNSGSVTETLRGLTVRKNIDYIAAQMQISYSGEYAGRALVGLWTFDTTTPFAAALNRFPSAGEVQLRGATGNVARYTASNRNPFALTGSLTTPTASGTFEVRGNLPQESFLFWDPLTGKSPRDGGYDVAPDTPILSSRAPFYTPQRQGNLTGIVLNQNGPIDVQFFDSSRTTGISGLQFVSESAYPNPEIVAANVSINGAIVLITPARPLLPNHVYRVTGNLGDLPLGDPFVTPHNIVANASAAPLVAEPGQQVVLSAAGTTVLNSTLGSATWTQIAGPAVTLDNPSALQSGFVMPAVADESSLEFEVRVTSASGAVSYDRVKVFALSSRATRTYVTWSHLNIAEIPSYRGFASSDAQLRSSVSTGLTSSWSSANGSFVLEQPFVPGAASFLFSFAVVPGGGLPAGIYNQTSSGLPRMYLPYEVSGACVLGPPVVTRFAVREAVFAPDDTPIRLAIDFADSCNHAGGFVPIGFIRINSDVPAQCLHADRCLSLD